MNIVSATQAYALCGKRVRVLIADAVVGMDYAGTDSRTPGSLTAADGMVAGVEVFWRAQMLEADLYVDGYGRVSARVCEIIE